MCFTIRQASLGSTILPCIALHCLVLCMVLGGVDEWIMGLLGNTRAIQEQRSTPVLQCTA